MSTVSAGLLNLSALTVSGDNTISANAATLTGAVSNATITGTSNFPALTTVNSTLTGPITAQTVNYSDSSGTRAYLQNTLTNIQNAIYSKGGVKVFVNGIL